MLLPGGGGGGGAVGGAGPPRTLGLMCSFAMVGSGTGGLEIYNVFSVYFVVSASIFNEF